MPNVKFLRGTQSDLAKYLSSGSTAAVEGAFYLTSDTNRLYIGKDIGSGTIRAVPVNQGINTVNNVAALENLGGEAGQFYYASAENVLCVYSGSTHGWVQINPDTNTYVDDRTITASLNSTTKLASVTDIIYNSNNSQIQTEWGIKAGTGMDATIAPKYALAKAFHSGVQYYTLSGSTYTAVNNVTSTTFDPLSHYERVGFELTLTPNEYSMTADVTGNDNNDLELTLTNGTSSSEVVVKAGSNIAFSKDGQDNIVLTATNTKVTSASLDPKLDSNDQPVNGFHLTVGNGDGSKAEDDIDPIIKVGSAGAYEETHFVGGIAQLPVYSKAQIDSLFKTFNAMEWRGVIQPGELPSSSVKNGYVYMAGDTFEAGTDGVNASGGDLIIATGTEGSDGFIPSNAITWQVVQAGNDTPVTYTFTNITNGVDITNSVGNHVGGIEVKASSPYLTATDSVDANTNGRIVTIAHAASQTAYSPTVPENSTQTERTNFSIPVPVIGYDSAGHITSHDVVTYTAIDTHANIANHSIGATVSSSTAATISDSFTVDGAAKSASFALTSNTLALSAGTNTGDLNVDLVWGSFN